MESWELKPQIEILTVRCNHIEQGQQNMNELAKRFARDMAMMSGQIERLEDEIKKLEKVIEDVQTQ